MSAASGSRLPPTSTLIVSFPGFVSGRLPPTPLTCAPFRIVPVCVTVAVRTMSGVDPPGGSGLAAV